MNHDEEGHFLIPKATIRNKALTLMTIYIPNKTATTFLKQNYRGCRDREKTLIIENFNTSQKNKKQKT